MELATAARMPQAQSQTLRAVADVFRSRWLADQTGLKAARRRLREKLLNLRIMSEDMHADRIISAPVNRAEQVTMAIDELAMLALGTPFGRTRPSRPTAEALVRYLEQTARTLQSGSPPDAYRAMELPGYPRTQAATELLASAIG